MTKVAITIAKRVILKDSVCNVVQKHILLYWVKYNMYSEKGTKIIGPLWQLQD